MDSRPYCPHPKPSPTDEGEGAPGYATVCAGRPLQNLFPLDGGRLRWGLTYLDSRPYCPLPRIKCGAGSNLPPQTGGGKGLQVMQRSAQARIQAGKRQQSNPPAHGGLVEPFEWGNISHGYLPAQTAANIYYLTRTQWAATRVIEVEHTAIVEEHINDNQTFES